MGTVEQGSTVRGIQAELSSSLVKYIEHETAEGRTPSLLGLLERFKELDPHRISIHTPREGSDISIEPSNVVIFPDGLLDLGVLASTYQKVAYPTFYPLGGQFRISTEVSVDVLRNLSRPVAG